MARRGLEQQLLSFFEANPDEELTYEDICLKFEVNYRYAKNTVSVLKLRGVLETKPVIVRRTEADKAIKS